MNVKKALPLLAAVALSVVPAKADSITFNINGTEGEPTYTQTEGGVTMNWFNPDAGFAFGHQGDEENGHLNLTWPLFFTSQFDFTFSADVRIIGYTIGAAQNSSNDATFDLSASGSIASIGNILSDAGYYSIANGGFVIGEGVTGTWISNIPFDSNGFSISSITVEVVPEPSTYALLGGALLVGAFLHRRRGAKLVS